MNPNLATLVIGDPRTGTSLAMRTCDLLGAPVSGHKFDQRKAEPGDEDIKALKDAAAKEMNPRGFYELPNVVMSGITKLNDITRGKVIKVMTVAAFPRQTRSGAQMGTDPDLVDKYLLCLRHPRHIAQSQIDLIGFSMQAGEKGWEYTKQPMTPDPFLYRMTGFVDWLSKQDDAIFDKILPIDFADMITKPVEMVGKIVDHLELRPGHLNLKLAVGNIDARLQRSSDFHKWPAALVHSGVAADQIYEALTSLDRGKLQAAAVMAADWLLEQRGEGATWVDDKNTWATIQPATARRLISNDRGLADNMKKSLEHYRRNGLIADQCEHYSRDPETTYTVQRPLDLGNLVRPMVYCHRDGEHKSVEICKFCWQRGSVFNGELRGPQRIRA